MTAKSYGKTELSKELDVNIKQFKSIFSTNDTLIVREFKNQLYKHTHCCILFLNGMVNSKIINENIIYPIIKNKLLGAHSVEEVFEALSQEVICAYGIAKQSDHSILAEAISSGDTVLLLNGHPEALIISTVGWQQRTVSEPESEKVVRGPREGFTESIIDNLALIRKRLRTPDLKNKFMEIGIKSKTKVSVIYLESLVNHQILEEVNKRLNEIEMNSILDSGYIEELIKDSPASVFSTVGSTERPDVIAGKLLEGRIAIVVDGSPFVLTVPFLFIEYFQSNEDYYNNYI